jgi:Zn-dependent peptidase ImmA (M78 family)
MVKTAMNREKIQHAAHRLHKEIWDNQERLWPNRHLTPFQMLAPEVAAHILGLDYQLLPNLGSPLFGREGERFKAAGLMNRSIRRIAVSTEFPPNVIRFTGAHEVGHFLLHEDEVMHRDKPLDGSARGQSRPPKEREADYFAACFLIPARLLLDAFAAQFQMKGPFPFTDTTCYHLNPSDPWSLLNAERDSLDREISLARCARFNNRNLIPLSVQFGVSDIAMAIRIKELQLVRWP